MGIWARYGGNGKCNDARIWREIIAKAKRDLVKNPSAQNILTFFEKNLDSIVVDRGFRDAEGDWFNFLSPQSKPKDDKQQTQGAADFSRFVTKVRNVIERINKVALKKWKILGGASMHWRYFDRLESLVRIASALWNCFHGPLDPQRTKWDESDLDTMLKVVYSAF